MPDIEDPYSESQLAASRAQIEVAHEAVLSIGQDCYARLCSCLSGLEYETGTADEAASALSARVLELCAMSLLCLRSGSVPSAKVLTRALLEASYKACALRRDPKHLDQLVNDDIAARLLLNKKIHDYKKDKRANHVARGVEKKIDELALHKAKKLEPSEWSARAGMTDFHRLFYAWLSSDTHTNVAAIDHYFVEERDYALEIGPRDIDLPMTVMILARCLLVVIRTLEAVPSDGSNAWHGSMERRLTALEESDA